MKIGLSMVADAKTDEERGQLRAALASVAPAVSGGVVVLDDRSLPEADDDVREAGFEPVRRAWDDDFAAARNFAQDRVNGFDWLVILDRDEVFHGAEELREQIHKAAESGYDALNVIVEAWPDDDTGTPERRPQRRAHAKKPEIAWKFAGHNQLQGYERDVFAGSELPKVVTSYKGKVLEKTYGRTNAILYRMLESDDPEDVLHAHLYLARTFVVTQEHDKAIQHCRAVLAERASDPSYAKAWRWLIDATNSTEGEMAARSVMNQALEAQPDSKELLHMAASLYIVAWAGRISETMPERTCAAFLGQVRQAARLLNLEIG